MSNLFQARKKASGGMSVDSLTITQMPFKTYYLQNETLDLTGLKVTATAGALSGDVSNLITTQPASGATMSTLGTNTVTISYGGATTTFDVTVAVVPETLNDCSWDLIQELAYAGTLGDYYNEGDTKEITIGANTITMQLASINNGTGTAGQYYPNGTADFVSVELLPDLHVMNSTATNVGGWNGSQMRTYLNETVYPTLPSDLKSVIVEKTHMRTAGNQSTSLVSASDKLWLPTTWEVSGISSTEGADYNIYYSIFPDSNSRKKHRKSEPTSAREWWLSSPIGNNSTNFQSISTYGSNTGENANLSRGVALCFRVGKSLENTDWDEIATLTRQGRLGDIAKEGDTKEITLTTNETLTLQLASINDGTGTAGTYYPANTADFISVELMDSTHVMNSTATNVGGWNDCEMRTYLNETVYPTLPTSLKNIVVDKTHMHTAGNKSHDLVSASDKLWLPTTYEMFGENSQYYLDDADHNIYYSIFPDNASRIKYRKAAPTSARYWWLSSPYVSRSTDFVDVFSDGSDGSSGAGNSAGVVLGLRIG